MLAFKIIRVDNEPDVFPAQLEDRVKRILDQIPAPFGLLTSHQYSIGTNSLTGFDVLIMAYARSSSVVQVTLTRGQQGHVTRVSLSQLTLVKVTIKIRPYLDMKLILDNTYKQSKFWPLKGVCGK